MIRTATVLVLPLAVLACAPVEDDQPFVSKAPAATVTGEPQRCLNASTISRTIVHDDRTIDFKVGSRTWRNTLPNSCLHLGIRRAISYDVRGNSLCASEVIYVLDGPGSPSQRGVSCALGEFVPVELAARSRED